MRYRGTYRPWDYCAEPSVRRVMDALDSDRFCPQEPGLFRWVHDALLTHGDEYFHLADFPSYVAAQAAAGRAVPAAGGVGAQGHPDGGAHGLLFQRPHHPGVRPRHLGDFGDLKRTSLYETHRAAGATLVPFAGWEMPVSYGGTVAEVHADADGRGAV